MSATHCGICGRRLFTSDPDSLDCGGDCWGCVKNFEGPQDKLTALVAQIAKGGEFAEVKAKALSALTDELLSPPLKRLMVTPGGHANPHEECPDCRGVCNPFNNEHYKNGVLK
jgi:hypothetical protein